jgi:hypothetical protein
MSRETARCGAGLLVAEAKALQWLFPDFVAEPQRYGLRLEKIFTGTRRNHLLL